MKQLVLLTSAMVLLSGCWQSGSEVAPAPTPTPPVLAQCAPAVTAAFESAPDTTATASATQRPATSPAPTAQIASESGTPIDLAPPQSWELVASGGYAVMYPQQKSSADKRTISVVVTKRSTDLANPSELHAFSSELLAQKKAIEASFSSSDVCTFSFGQQPAIHYHWQQQHPDHGPQQGTAVTVLQPDRAITITLTATPDSYTTDFQSFALLLSKLKL